MATATATATANGQSSRALLPWLNLMATEPFYILHIAAFSSYFAARASASPDVSHRLLQRVLVILRDLIFFFSIDWDFWLIVVWSLDVQEIQAILAFSVLAVVKVWWFIRFNPVYYVKNIDIFCDFS